MSKDREVFKFVKEADKEVDLSGVVEIMDNSNLTGELACAGGACEVL